MTCAFCSSVICMPAITIRLTVVSQISLEYLALSTCAIEWQVLHFVATNASPGCGVGAAGSEDPQPTKTNVAMTNAMMNVYLIFISLSSIFFEIHQYLLIQLSLIGIKGNPMQTEFIRQFFMKNSS